MKIPVIATAFVTALSLCWFAPRLASAQAESPYSFAAGSEKNVQKEDGSLAEASSDLISTLRGPRGESLAIASTGLALFSYICALRAGAIVFGIMGILFVTLSHPFIGLALACIGLAIYRYRTRYQDDEFMYQPKALDSKDSGKPGVSAPTTVTISLPVSVAPPVSPKINRPL